MARFDPKHHSLNFSALKDAVVIITGGATGMGREAVRLFSTHGSKVNFGDNNREEAQKLCSSLASDSVHLIPMDARRYQDNLRLFKFAMSEYGRVDHAIANAGIMERCGWFDAGLTLDDLENCPDTSTLDVNLTGPVSTVSGRTVARQAISISSVIVVLLTRLNMVEGCGRTGKTGRTEALNGVSPCGPLGKS
jgi:NAD(P)-dependent dehydrogenase (short-subunit alcohol dehydrogenase family)